MANSTVWRIAPDASITLAIEACDNGEFFWSVVVEASPRAVRKPFYRQVDSNTTKARGSARAPTVAEAVAAAEKAATLLRDDLLRAYAAHDARVAIDRDNVSRAERAFPAEGEGQVQ